MIDPLDFPRLQAGSYRVTSPETIDYNCIAWAACHDDNWWQPGIYWPIACAQDDFSLGVLEDVFISLGYSECVDGTLEVGFEKVALYGLGMLYTHAARQLPDGSWTSKLGKGVDIVHTAPDDIAGGVYGEVVEFMKRPVSQARARTSMSILDGAMSDFNRRREEDVATFRQWYYLLPSTERKTLVNDLQAIVDASKRINGLGLTLELNLRVTLYPQGGDGADNIDINVNLTPSDILQAISGWDQADEKASAYD